MSQRLTSNQVQVAESAEAVSNLFIEKGWSDGLPMIPPTEEAVEELFSLRGLQFDPDLVMHFFQILKKDYNVKIPHI